MDQPLNFGMRSADGWFSSDLNITLETISNLAFLAHERADDPEEVRKYTELIQDRISVFSRNLRRRQK